MTRHSLHWLGLGVFALAWLAYGIALGGDYVFDDVHSVAANQALGDLGNVWRLLSDPSAFSSVGHRMYRPALLVSFALNLALSPEPWSLKAGNVLLHAGTAWLLWQWLRTFRVRTEAAFAVAAVFAVHPLVSETVNLVSARSELLLAFGVLLALCSHRGWQRGARPWLCMAGMLVGTVLACGSKETGVVLPALLAVQAVCARPAAGVDWRRAAFAMVPVAALVIGYLVLRKVLLGEATVEVLARTAGDPRIGGGRTLSVQLATMGTLLPRALLQMVVPTGLTLDPPVVFRSSLLDPFTLLGWASLLGLSVAAWARGRRAAARRVGLAVAWCTALPWIVVPLNVPLAEHRLYGPMLGLALVAAAMLPRLRGRRALTGLVALLLLGIGGAVHRSLDYRDELGLWQAELRAQPDSFAANWGMGATLLRRDDPQAALPWLERACAMRPAFDDSLSHYVEALVKLDDAHAAPLLAVRMAEALAARRPHDAWMRTLVAQAALQAGRVTGDHTWFERAERVALSCLEIAPPKGYVYRLAAAARRGLGDLEGALAHLDTSLRRGLDHAEVRVDRAATLRALGRRDEARRELLQAQRDAPTDPMVMRALIELAQPPR